MKQLIKFVSQPGLSIFFIIQHADSSSFDSTPSISQSYIETITQTVSGAKATNNAPISTTLIVTSSTLLFVLLAAPVVIAFILGSAILIKRKTGMCFWSLPVTE